MFDSPRTEQRGVSTIGLLVATALATYCALALAGAALRVRAPHRHGTAGVKASATRPARPEAHRRLPPAIDPPTSVPPLATIAGIRVGYDGMDRLERRLGPGAIMIGGHPQGARVWNIRASRWWLYADGFTCRSGA